MEKKKDKNNNLFSNKNTILWRKTRVIHEENPDIDPKAQKAYYFFQFFNSLKTSLKPFSHSTNLSGKHTISIFLRKSCPFSYSTSFPHSPQNFPHKRGKNSSSLFLCTIFHTKSPRGKSVENASRLALWNISTFPASLLLILN